MKNSTKLLLIVLLQLACATSFAQFNPTAPASGFNVFVKGNVTFNTGRTDASVALGGDATLAGNAEIANVSATNYPTGSNTKFGLVIGGKVIFQSGNQTKVNNGYLRLGSINGARLFYADCNNFETKLKVTPFNTNCQTSFNSNPNLFVNTNPRQATGTATEAHNINFTDAFTTMQANAVTMSQYTLTSPAVLSLAFPVINNSDVNNPTITLVSGKVNVLNMTGTSFTNIRNLKYLNKPSANTPVVFNINHTGSLTWNPANTAQLSNTDGAFIIYNFYNNTNTINISNSNPIYGTVFAPFATVEKNHVNSIFGQVIANNYVMNGGDVNTFTFNATLPANTLPLGIPVVNAITNVNHNSFTASWNALAAATGYKIDVSTSQNFTAGTLLSGFTDLLVNANNITVTGLQENTDYFVRLRAINLTGVTGNSNTVTVITNFNPTTTIFKTKASGNFSATNMWMYNLKRSEFRDTTLFPCAQNKIEVLSGHKLLMDVDHTVASNGSFVVNTGASLVIKAAKAFTIAGVVNFNGQEVTFKSDSTGTARLGEITGRLTGATNVIVERFVNAGRRWRLLTAPINGTTIHDAWQEGKTWNGLTTPDATFTGTLITGQQQGNAAKANANGFDFWPAISNSSSSVQNYVRNPNGTGSWKIMPNTNGTFNTVTAYMIFIRGDRSFSTGSSKAYTVLAAKGELKDAALTATGIVYPTAQSLLGNPFASPIDFDKFYKANTTVIKRKFWSYDANLNTYGGYRLIEGSDDGYETIPANLTGNGNTDYRFIESGQGFFVMPTGSFKTETTATFAQNQKTDGVPAKGVFKSSIGGKDEQLWINLNLLNNTTTVLADGVKAKFSNKYSSDIDGDDATKTTNLYENLSIFRNNNNLTVEARKLVIANDTIFLNLSGTPARNYQFQIKGANFNRVLMTAYLEDNFLKTSTPISLDGSIINVNFTVTSNSASTGANRFRIVLKSTPFFNIKLSTIPTKKNSTEIIALNWNVINIKNILKYTIEKSTDGTLYNVAGEVDVQTATSDASYTWNDDAPQAGDNIYRIKMTAVTGAVAYSEISAVKIDDRKSGISVYPNPVTNNLISLQLNKLDMDKYTLALYNAAGQQIVTQQIVHQGGSIAKSIQLDSRVAPGVYKLQLKGTKNKSYNLSVLIK